MDRLDFEAKKSTVKFMTRPHIDKVHFWGCSVNAEHQIFCLSKLNLVLLVVLQLRTK